MKLAVCIVHNRDKGKLSDALVKGGFKSTIIGSSGGFLREGNTTFLIGHEDDERESLFQIVQENCEAREQLVNLAPFEANPGSSGLIGEPVKVPVGGAVMFVIDVHEFMRF